MAKKDSKGNKVKDDAEEKPRETTVEFLASLAAVLVTGLFIITFAVQAFEIPSSSMENTLLIGDHVFVNRIVFAPKTSWVGPLLPYRHVRHGDIVVFLHPDPHDAGTYVVKRIIGVPGDRIHLREWSGVSQWRGVEGALHLAGSECFSRRSLPQQFSRSASVFGVWRLSELDCGPGVAR